MQFAMHRLAQNSRISINDAFVPIYSLASYDTASLACRYDADKQVMWLKFDWQNQPFNFILTKGTNGITPADPVRIQFYPNPVNDLLTVSWGDCPASSVSVKIGTIGGLMLLEKQVDSASRGTLIDLAALQPGLYLLYLQTGKWSRVLKLVKQ
jgi:hypothetical protein